MTDVPEQLTFSLHAMKTVLMDHAIEGMALFDSTVAVVGRGGVYLYEIKPDAAGTSVSGSQ
jgi:hypothetical protein